MATDNEVMVDITRLSKTYHPDIQALKDISLQIQTGEMIFLTGMSGAGKTTLLRLICGIEQPTKGFVEVNGHDLSKISNANLQNLRRRIGVAYQNFKLLPERTVAQNIAISMEVAYRSRLFILKQTKKLLAQLHLQDKYAIRTGKLSRGEQQRIAIARAVANKPDLILADEPTGNLDAETTSLVMDLFHQCHLDGTTLLIATHDKSIYEQPDSKVVRLGNGRILETGNNFNENPASMNHDGVTGEKNNEFSVSHPYPDPAEPAVNVALTTAFSVNHYSIRPHILFFYLVYTNALNAGKHLGDDLRLIVYLDEEPDPTLQEQYRYKILKFDEVDKIEFISSKQAYNRFQEQLEDNKDVLADIPKDFLPPSIEIYPVRTLDSLSRIKRFSDYLQTLPGVLKVQYGRQWVERFYAFIELLRIVVILSGSLLILTTTFMLGHSIRLTLLTRKKEIELLKLVGASNSYIRMPFFLEGALLGLLGSVAGIGALYMLFNWIELRFAGSAMPGMFSFKFFSASTIFMVIGVSVALCSCGSYLSTRRIAN